VFRVVPERAWDDLARGVDGEVADVLGRGGSVLGVGLYRASTMWSRPPGSSRASPISSQVCFDIWSSHGGLAPFHLSGHDGEEVTFEVIQLDGPALVFEPVLSEGGENPAAASLTRTSARLSSTAIARRV
jgi:hypothetical protein